MNERQKRKTHEESSSSGSKSPTHLLAKTLHQVTFDEDDTQGPKTRLDLKYRRPLSQSPGDHVYKVGDAVVPDLSVIPTAVPSIFGDEAYCIHQFAFKDFKGNVFVPQNCSFTYNPSDSVQVESVRLKLAEIRDHCTTNGFEYTEMFFRGNTTVKITKSAGASRNYSNIRFPPPTASNWINPELSVQPEKKKKTAAKQSKKPKT